MLAFALLTASVVLGLTLSGRARPWRRLGGADNQDARALPVRPSAPTGRAARLLFQTTSEPWPRFAVEDVHRFVGLLAGGFVGVHVLALLVDTYVPFSLGQVLVPFTSSYRPLATGLGVVALELLAALAVANRYRKRLSYRFWRRTHYLEFAVWAFALVHGIASGTDSGTPWGLLVYGAAAASVAGLLVWRLAGGSAASAYSPAR
jgi:hypothetical protein